MPSSIGARNNGAACDTAAKGRRIVVRRETSIAADWYAVAFDTLYPVVYAHRSTESAAAEAAFAAAKTRLGPGDRVLDLCCGAGRHMVHLAAHTSRLFGLDYSSALLASARSHVVPTSGLVRGDMRALPFGSRTFDVVLNFFTSFGYFVEEEKNQTAARELGRVLTAGGRFFLDYLNAGQVRATLLPHSERREGTYFIIEDRWLDEPAARVNKRTTVLQDGTVMAVSEESVRLYSVDELTGLLAEAGLTVEQRFGDFAGAPLREDSPRMILVGSKVRDHV